MLLYIYQLIYYDRVQITVQWSTEYIIVKYNTEHRTHYSTEYNTVECSTEYRTVQCSLWSIIQYSTN